MENRYDEVMKKIEVTEEMQERILHRLHQLDLGQELGQKPKKLIPFPNFKKYISIAACFLFLLVGSIIIHNSTQPVSEVSKPPVMETPDITEFISSVELSQAIGFTMKEISDVPFKIDQIHYASYWSELGEISYIGGDNQIVLRMSARNEDVSGDYTKYENKKEVIINGNNVIMKGDNNQYVLAIWQSEGFSYSVQFTKPVSEQVMLNSIKSVQ